MTGRECHEGGDFGFIRREKPDRSRLDTPASAEASNPATRSHDVEPSPDQRPADMRAPLTAERPDPVLPVRPGRPRNRGGDLADPKATAARQQAAPSASTMPVEDDRNWVVRPKNMSAPPNDRQAAAPPSAARIKPGLQRHTLPSAALEGQRGERSRRWLAICLASTVYITGAAGLWSMYRTFEEPASPSITPAGDRETLPPLDETIDVRDALLKDGIFRPMFKPDIEGEEDVANSDLQTQS